MMSVGRVSVSSTALVLLVSLPLAVVDVLDVVDVVDVDEDVLVLLVSVLTWSDLGVSSWALMSDLRLSLCLKVVRCSWDSDGRCFDSAVGRYHVNAQSYFALEQNISFLVTN